MPSLLARTKLAARVLFGQRHFQAARVNRLNRNWPAIATSMARDLYAGLAKMRGRMRFLAQNSDFFVKYIALYQNNVIGPYGMKLQVTGGTEQQNKEFETKFKEWSQRKFASASGRLTWAQIQRRAAGSRARDGEALIREIYGKNKFGYALKFYDVGWLDETYNLTPPQGGNRIIMSVEIDEDDRPVAYWLTPPAIDSQFRNSQERKRTRIPAEEIHHVFAPDDECATDDTVTRGTPPGHTPSLTLFRLDLTDEANLISMQAGASKMGFYTEKLENEFGAEEGQLIDKSTNQPAKLKSRFEAGTFEKLPPGVDVKQFDPGFPKDSHAPFAKYLLRRISSGFKLFYHSLTGDLSEVNLSSMRGGMIEEREMYKAEQELFAEHLCRPVVENFGKNAMLAGIFQTIGPRDLQKLQFTFQPRRWPWPDPLKDVQTQRLAVEAGFTTVTDTLAEMGDDILEVFTKRKAELELAAKMGIPLATGAGSLAPGTLDAQGEDQPKPNNAAGN